MGASPVRILIVEDEAAHLEAIKRSLGNPGMEAEVLVAGSLSEYRKIVAEKPPDIALVDLNLPDGNALEVLTVPPEAGSFPILVMTSYGTEEIAVKALKAGALDYVVKSPEAFAVMPQTVARARREWKLLQERQQAEEALRQAYDELELRVLERTQELRQTIQMLMMEMEKREQAEGELKQSEERLRFLSAQLLTIQENERKRLAAELHDELGHAILTMKLNLRGIERKLLPEQTLLKNEVLAQLDFIDSVIDEVRRLYRDLSPGDLEDLGLTRALRNLVEEFSGYYEDIDWKVNIAAIEPVFPLPVQTMIYRMMQEGLTNIGKHATPDRVDINVAQTEDKVIIHIKDDGRGFPMADGPEAKSRGKGMGLLALAERVNLVGGTLDLWSQENQGTRITIAIPILPQA